MQSERKAFLISFIFVILPYIIDKGIFRACATTSNVSFLIEIISEVSFGDVPLWNS
jgi:hypothetical protein